MINKTYLLLTTIKMSSTLCLVCRSKSSSTSVAPAQFKFSQTLVCIAYRIAPLIAWISLVSTCAYSPSDTPSRYMTIRPGNLLCFSWYRTIALLRSGVAASCALRGNDAQSTYLDHFTDAVNSFLAWRLYLYLSGVTGGEFIH